MADVSARKPVHVPAPHRISGDPVGMPLQSVPCLPPRGRSSDVTTSCARSADGLTRAVTSSSPGLPDWARPGWRTRSPSRMPPPAPLSCASSPAPQPVSYTHLDVYKRQRWSCSSTSPLSSGSARRQANSRTIWLRDTSRSRWWGSCSERSPSPGPGSVSYTHLDVYKRQTRARSLP